MSETANHACLNNVCGYENTTDLDLFSLPVLLYYNDIGNKIMVLLGDNCCHEKFMNCLKKNTEIRELFRPYLEYYGAIYEATTEEK